MGGIYYGRNGRVNIRWSGWRDEQPERYPLEVIETRRLPPRRERLNLSRFSDTPRRVVPPPANAPNPRALVLATFPPAEARSSRESAEIPSRPLRPGKKARRMANLNTEGPG